MQSAPRDLSILACPTHFNCISTAAHLFLWVLLSSKSHTGSLLCPTERSNLFTRRNTVSRAKMPEINIHLPVFVPTKRVGSGP